MNIFIVIDNDGKLIAEFDDKDAADRYSEGATGGPFRVDTSEKFKLPGATENES